MNQEEMCHKHFFETKWQRQVAKLEQNTFSSTSTWDGCLSQVKKESQDDIFNNINAYVSSSSKGSFRSLRFCREIKDFLPTGSDGSWQAYFDRVSRCLPREGEWLVELTNTHNYSPSLTIELRQLLEPIMKLTGIPIGHISLKLFAGRFNASPTGICSNLNMEVISGTVLGTRNLVVWPLDHWSGFDFDLPPSLQRLSQDDLQSAESIKIDTNEVSYLPANHWSIELSSGFSLFYRIGIEVPTQSQVGERIRTILVEELFSHMASESFNGLPEYSGFLPFNSPGVPGELPKLLESEAENIQNASKEIGKLAQHWWIKRIRT